MTTAPIPPGDPEPVIPPGGPGPVVAGSEYHLKGDDITVSFYDIIGDRDRDSLRLTYQDANRSLKFSHDDVRTVSVEDLGTIVSVTLVPPVDVSRTSFSLLIPPVSRELPAAPIQAVGITTLDLLVPPQSETYKVTKLSGTVGVISSSPKAGP